MQMPETDRPGREPDEQQQWPHVPGQVELFGLAATDIKEDQ